MKAIIKYLCLVSAGFPMSSLAQIEMTHSKNGVYDMYSVINPVDSSFSFIIEADGDSAGEKDLYNAILNQTDSMMYRFYGDKYDSEARNEMHKKLLKDLKKKQKESARNRRKLVRKANNYFNKKVIKEHLRPDKV